MADSPDSLSMPGRIELVQQSLGYARSMASLPCTVDPRILPDHVRIRIVHAYLIRAADVLDRLCDETLDTGEDQAELAELAELDQDQAELDRYAYGV